MRSLAASLLLFLASASALADEYFVERTAGPGIEVSDLATVDELIRASVREGGGHSVVEKPADADFTLRPKLLKLGGAYVMTLEKLMGGAVVFSTQMKAMKMDEMDLVARRLTRAVIGEVAVADDARVGDVSEHEATSGMARKPARNGYFIGIGPTALANMNTDGVAYGIQGGYSWDLNTVMIRFLGDVALSGDAVFGTAGLAGTYFLTDHANTPFLALDLGYGGYHTDTSVPVGSETGGGFAAGAGAGVSFLRTSAINVEVSARLATIFDESTLGLPLAISARLALYF